MRVYLTSFIFLFLLSCGEQSPTALGTLERERIVHNATAAMIITQQPIAEGSAVKKGDLLVQLNDREQRANLSLSEAQLNKAQARWDELSAGARKEDIEAARAELAGAEANLSAIAKAYDRKTKLHQDRLISQADYDDAVAQWKNAKAQVKTANEHLLVLTNGVREEVLRQAEADINIAQAQVEVNRIKLNDLKITATRDGILDTLPWNIGERVNVGTPVAIVLADSSPYARVYVPEKQRTQLQVGQSFAVYVDGYKEPFNGKLRWVADDPAFTPYYALNQADRARLVYLAEIDVDKAEQLPSGVPVQVAVSSTHE